MTLDAIGIAGTGLSVHRKWLDAVADNLANMNTASPTGGEALLREAGLGARPPG